MQTRIDAVRVHRHGLARFAFAGGSGTATASDAPEGVIEVGKVPLDGDIIRFQ